MLQRVTAESDKALLLEQKAAAEAEAKAAAEAEVAYKARQMANKQSVAVSGNTTLSDQVSNFKPSSSDDDLLHPAPAPTPNQTPTYSTNVKLSNW